MSGKVCNICADIFNTKNHKPLIIPRCSHNICEVAARKYKFAFCPEDNVEYADLESKDLQVDEKLLAYISSQELPCSNHSQECAVSFCSTHNSAQCYDCKHQSPCKTEDLGENDSCVILKEAIARVTEVCGLNKTEVMYAQESVKRADEKYRILTNLLQEQRPVVEMCSVHGTTQAQFVHVKDLRPACQQCAKKCPEDYCHLSDLGAKEILEQAFKKYNQSLHFYLFPETLLKFLAIIQSLDTGYFVQVALRLIHVRYKKSLKRGDQMFCPLCLRPASDFHRLPCTSAIHAICASCDLNLVREYQVFCPLDHNRCTRNRNPKIPVMPKRAELPPNPELPTNPDLPRKPELPKNPKQQQFALWESLDLTECENNPRAAPIPESRPTLRPNIIDTPQEDKNQFCTISLSLYSKKGSILLPCSHLSDADTVISDINAFGFVKCSQCRNEFGLSRLSFNRELKDDLDCVAHQSKMQYFCLFHHLLFCARDRNKHSMCRVEPIFINILEPLIEQSIRIVQSEYQHWNDRLETEYSQLPHMNMTGKYQLLKDLLRYQPQHEPEDLYGYYFREKHNLYRVKGTPIPPPQLSVEGIFAVNRFFALQPPENCPQDRLLDQHLRPWVVQSSQNQTEAFVFRLSRDAIFKGLTLACPIDCSKFYIDRAELRHGIGTMDDLDFVLLPPALLVDPENALVKDFLFQAEFQLFAETPYTLLLVLKAVDRQSELAFYQGNAITAPDILIANEDMLVEIDEAQSEPKEIIGQNNIQGPILRLFFSLPPDVTTPI